MAINYPLTFPSHTGIANVVLRQVTASKLTESPFTFKQQAIVHTGQRWEAEVSLPPMKHADARQWISWLSSLRGTRGTFLMGDPLGAVPQGSAGGIPLVNGANQTGGSLVIDGATVSQVGWLKAGDYIQLGSGANLSYHMVLADADSDVSGNVTLDLWPDVRIAPADNTALTVASAVGQWRLSSNEMMWDVNNASIYGINFTAIEAIP